VIDSDLPEALRDWAKMLERDECAKETLRDALLMAADRIEWLEEKLYGNT